MDESDNASSMCVEASWWAVDSQHYYIFHSQSSVHLRFIEKEEKHWATSLIVCTISYRFIRPDLLA